eukprot:COSAG01_NODE_566_length_15422_cov_8.342622_5_plen_99_part_00
MNQQQVNFGGLVKGGGVAWTRLAPLPSRPPHTSCRLRLFVGPDCDVSDSRLDGLLAELKVARANHKNSTEAHELAKQQLLDFKPQRQHPCATVYCDNR